MKRSEKLYSKSRWNLAVCLALYTASNITAIYAWAMWSDQNEFFVPVAFFAIGFFLLAFVKAQNAIDLFKKASAEEDREWHREVRPRL